MKKQHIRSIKLAVELVKERGDIYLLILSSKLRTKEKVDVVGTINGIDFETTMIPWNDKYHAIVAKGKLKTRLKRDKDGRVQVTLIKKDQLIEAEEIPADFEQVLSTNHELRKKFDSLSKATKIKIIGWIESAREQVDRLKRIQKCVDLILSGQIYRLAGAFS